MERDIQIYERDGRCFLVSPWHPELGPFVDQMQGKWQSIEGACSFPAALYPYVRAFALRVYEDDGLVPMGSFELRCAIYSEHRQVVLAGRTVVRRAQPSRRPVLGQNVLLTSGSFGFLDHWTGREAFLGKNDATLLLWLPASLHGRGISGLSLVTLPDAAGRLADEQQRLAARLQQIKSDLVVLRTESAAS